MTHLRNTVAAAIAMIAAAAFLPGPARASGEAAPTGAVEGVRSPVEPGELLQLLLYAYDSGPGLANAEASIDGQTVAFVRLGAGSCPEHPSSSATIEPSLGAGGCPESVAKVPLSVPVGAAGSHQLRVSVTDAAGDRTTLVDETIAVASAPPPGSNTVTIGIGSEGSPGGGSGVEEGGPGSSYSGAPGSAGGGVLGYSAGRAPVACYRPKLTMRLVSKPLRYARVGRRRVPVLLARRHYRYRGALTCLLNGHRVSAPAGTVVHVLNRVGRRILKAGRRTITVHKGVLRASLGYTSARTIVFRYGPIDGELVQVKLPIRIARKHAKTATDRRAKTRKRGRAALVGATLPRSRTAPALGATVVAALASAAAVNTEEGTSIGGTVESTLGLSVGEPSAFTRSAASRRGRVFTARIPIEVTATEGPTWLSVADGEAFAGPRRGRLVRGTSTLAIPLRAAAGGGPYRSLDATVDPELEGWGRPVSLEAATIRLRQTVRGRAPRTLRGYHELLLVTITAAGP